jgi:hypothetical protein
MSATAKAVSVPTGIPHPWRSSGGAIPGVEERRQGDPPQRGEHREGPRPQRREVADGELALDLEPDHEEEDRQEAVVDPVEQRVRERAPAPLHAEGRLPPRREGRGEGRVAEREGRQRGQRQEQPRRGAPAHELEGRRLDAVTERAQHGVGHGALVPGAGVAPAVDEEGRRQGRAAPPRALDVLVHPGPRGLVGREAEVPREPVEVVRREGRGPLHEGLVDLPEAPDLRRALRQLGGAPRRLVALGRQVAEDVAHARAEAAPQPLHDLVDGAARLAGVAAVLHQRHLGAGRAQDVVPGDVDREVEPVSPAHRPSSSARVPRALRDWTASQRTAARSRELVEPTPVGRARVRALRPPRSRSARPDPSRGSRRRPCGTPAA